METGQGGRRTAIYARVSTSDQSTAMQLVDLHRYADARGFIIVEEYTDAGISGAKKRRPALDRLMDEARKKRFDVVLVWRFDRFARSTKHLLDVLEEFRHLGIDFISYNENLDTSSPIGEAMFTIIAAIAKLERDIIRERVTAGVRQAMKRRAFWGRRKIEQANPEICRRITELRDEGRGMVLIGKIVGVSSRTVWRVLRSQDAPPVLPSTSTLKPSAEMMQTLTA